ncbi:MAG: hypothetical protein CML40_10890 [Rhodobacteraceae bacterium]|nr:MAG: hypothetical protein CML40_10890 [Paracoccaceae bacterium]|tara:strand:- start:305 stop:568 length:264 start_codon:yes stop_codon:yes gene_type:complete
MMNFLFGRPKLDTKEYMVDGWDRGPRGSHPYKRGSLHNKIGMVLMWSFYGIVIAQLIHAFIVLPFFPIWATISAIMVLMSIVVIVAP